MSIQQLLSMTRRSFTTLDAAMNTAGQNVANVNTPGYSRRRLTLQADASGPYGIHSRPRGGVTGAGVSVQSYERIRDTLLDRAGWNANTGLSGAHEEHRLLSAVESVFPARGDGALNNLLTNFWNGWSEVADYPTDQGVRLSLRGRASSLASALNRFDSSLNELQNQAGQVLSDGLEELNGLLSQVASLNDTIRRARHAGAPDLAAEDQRDLLVRELSSFGPIQVQDDAQGYTVSLDGMTLVQGKSSTALTLDASGSPPVVTFGDTGIPYEAPAEGGGRLGAWLRTLTDTLPDARAGLDAIAAALVSEVNALHQTGAGLDGATGRDFFDAAGTTAATIRLSDDVLADAKAIAASADPTAAGDSEIALAIAALADARILDGASQTAGNFAIHLVSGIGARAQAAANTASGQAAVLDHLDGLAQSVSGVSLEEEMTRLIEYQHAFAATARVLNTAQDMMDTLLRM